MKMTPKMFDFVQAWLENFPKPRDWSDASIESEMSSFPGYASWIERNDTSMGLVVDCLKEFAPEEFGPRLGKLRKLYNHKCHKNQAHKGTGRPRDRCEACASEGIITVATIEVQGAPYILDRPRPAQRLGRTTVPCMCTQGDKRNEKFGYTPSLRQRAFDARVANLFDFFDLERECRALVGVMPARPPTPVPAFTEAVEDWEEKI